MNEKRYLILIVCLMVMIITPVMASFAETGELGTGEAETILSISGNPYGSSSGAYKPINHTYYNFAYKKPINAWYQFQPDLTADIQFRNPVTFGQGTAHKNPDGSFATYGSTSVDLYIENVSVGSATFGYQFVEKGTANGVFDQNGETMLIYINYNEDFYESTSLYTGIKLIEMRDNNNPQWYIQGCNNLSSSSNLDMTTAQATTALASRHTLFAYKASTSTYQALGNKLYPTLPQHTMYNAYKYKFRNEYLVMKTEDSTEISFVVDKTVDSEIYMSRVYLYNASNLAQVLFSEPSVNADSVEFYQFGGTDFRLAIYDYGGIWWNKTIHVPSLSEASYTLYLDKSTLSASEETTATIYSYTDSTLAGLNKIVFQYTDALGTAHEMRESGNDNLKMRYVKIAGIWRGWDESNNTYSNFKSSAPVDNTVSFPTTGNIRLYAYLTTTSDIYHTLVKNLTITGETLIKTEIRLLDYETGGYIVDSDINVYNYDTGVWSNTTNSAGQKIWYALAGTSFNVLPEAEGYAYKSVTSKVPDNDWILPIYLYPDAGISGKMQLSTSVFDKNTGAGIGGAKVDIGYTDSITGLEASESKYTTDSGLAKFVITNNTVVRLTASKSGYQAINKVLTIGSGDGVYPVTVYLTSISEVTIVTTAPTTIPTTVGGYGGQIGGNITPSICRPNRDLPEGSTLVDFMLNNIACSGIKTGENQGYILGIIVVGLLLIFGAKFGKAVGAGFGAGAGFVISCAMGLFPLWLFIAFVIVAMFTIALVIWRKQ